MSAATAVAGYPVHAVTEFSRWTNPYGADFKDWRALCGASGTETGHQPFKVAGSARRRELCHQCFPFRSWEPAKFIDRPVEVSR